MGGEEAVHLLGEVLDHVGSLELAVDQDVEAHLLLPGDGVRDELGHGGVVVRPVQLPLPEPDAELPHVVRLRQRAGGRGRIRREVEVGLGCASDPSETRGRRARRSRATPPRGGRRHLGCRAALDGIRPRGEGSRLLTGELEPGGELLALDGYREEHQARRGHEADGTAVVDRGDRRASGIEVVRPRRAAVHDGHDMLRLGGPPRRADQLRDMRHRHLDREPESTERLERRGGGVAELDRHDRGRAEGIRDARGTL